MRLIAALVEVAGERGAGEVTVAHIVARSGVSRRTFYELFEDREACFVAAFDLALERAALRVPPVFRAPGAWRERIAAGMLALLEFIEEEPGMGRLLIVDSLAAGPRVLQRRADVVRGLIDSVDAGRRKARDNAQTTRLTAEGVVGAVLAVLHARLAGDPRRSSTPQEPVAGLLGPLLGIVFLPYLGRAAAAREAARPAPPRRRVAHVGRDPLRDLDMRLTYRTVRVLLAIAGQPGASNRRVADAAGVHDQGQISKLLARLEHLGLIDNACTAPARGEPNAWRLTARGEQVAQTIGQQSGAAVGG